MATKIYDSATIYSIDGEQIYITPLKIKYLRDFMDLFDQIKTAKSDLESVSIMSDCAVVAMRQYYPSIKTVEEFEEKFDIKTLYKIVEIASGTKFKDEPDDKPQKEDGATWETLDLAKIESEAFLLGIWKDYEELESSISMPELIAILEAKREDDYNQKRFMAAMQGIDLDKQSGKQDAWEELKARVYSKGQASNSKDILALQGVNAEQAGFGIGMGLEYEKIG